MRDRTSTLFKICALTLLLSTRAVAVERVWDVTIAVRASPGPNKAAEIRIALPQPSSSLTVEDIQIDARGLESALVTDDPHPHIRLSGNVVKPRRLAVSFRVRLASTSLIAPTVRPVDVPGAELLPFLNPAPLFQSRSILVREFLESKAGPRIDRSRGDLLDPILTTVRTEIRRSRDGKSLALDVIRRRAGKQIGIERVFTTALRCAGIPARFVEGLRLNSSTRRKRTFWTEVFSDGQWFPVSASGGWMGEIPTDILPLARDGTRVVEASEGMNVTYTVNPRLVAIPRTPKQ